ncbi:ribonuclease Y [bacterium]|nr:ribonuclease Y [bacterium]
MPVIISIIVMVVIGCLGFGIGWLISRNIGRNKIKGAETKAQQIIDDAQKEIEIMNREAKLQAKAEWLNQKAEFERQTQNRRAELRRVEKKIESQEESLERKANLINRREQNINNKEKNLGAKEKAIVRKESDLDQLINEQNKLLERIAGMSAEEAKQILMKNLESQARQEAVQIVKRIKEKAERDAEKEAREIIIGAIQRCAADTVVESTVSVVSLPSDELKGRIIGREGRNIRAFEIATGIDVIVDDTPEAVILSGYDPIRREIAKIALEKLILDGRIHPSRIEEVVEKAKQEIEVIIRENGEQACFEVGILNMHPELVNYLGKLTYRTSYGQNVLQHSKEVAFISGLIANELDMDVTLAKRAGLLHDIGKAIDKAVEGTHTQLGYELAKKFNENEIVLNAILSHHEDTPPTSSISVIVQAADAISGARPGARRETIENYVKRLERLEELADSFPGVSKTYAIQAGREVRVIVEPNRINDSQAAIMSTEIAQRVQSEMEYPGQVKITVIRETRSVDYAK